MNTEIRRSIVVGEETLADKIRSLTSNAVIQVMRILNIFNGMLLIACYPILFAARYISFSFTHFWLFAYTTFFGTTLIIFELRIHSIAELIRENFGFLFSFMGRALFISFLASLCMASKEWIGISIGILTMVNALFNCFIILSHPAFKFGGELYRAETNINRVDESNTQPIEIATPIINPIQIIEKEIKKEENPYTVGRDNGNNDPLKNTKIKELELPPDNPFNDI